MPKSFFIIGGLPNPIQRTIKERNRVPWQPPSAEKPHSIAMIARFLPWRGMRCAGAALGFLFNAGW
jgi:hypothetical protein